MRISGFIDEAAVSVDVSLLEAALAPWPVGAVALLLGLGAVAWLVAIADAERRLVVLGASVAALACAGPLWLALSGPAPLPLPELEQPWRAASRVVLLGGVAAALGLAALALGWWLARARPALLALGAVALVAGAAVAASSLGSRAGFAGALAAVGPVPNVSAPQVMPELHLGETRTLALPAQHAGARGGLFFISREPLPPAARAAWGLDAVVVSAAAKGEVQLPLHLERGPVAVDATVTVRGVEDVGPGSLPLAVGNRWVFERVQGRSGATLQRAAAVARGKKKLPALPALTLTVTGERVVDGLHRFELMREQEGLDPMPLVLVRRDGALVNEHGVEQLRQVAEGLCEAPFLPVPRCACDSRQLPYCRSVAGESAESWLRLFLAVVTVGLSEIAGVGKDLGGGAEEGLLLTAWRVDGVEAQLGPPPPSPPRPATGR